MKNKLTVLLAMFTVAFAWYAMSGPVTITGVGSGGGAGSDTTAIHTGTVANVTGITNSASTSIVTQVTLDLLYHNLVGFGWTNGASNYASIFFNAPCGPNDVTNTYYIGTHNLLSTRQDDSPQLTVGNYNGSWEIYVWGNGTFPWGQNYNGAIDFGAANWIGSNTTNAYGEANPVIRIGRANIFQAWGIDRTTSMFLLDTNYNATLGVSGKTISLPGIVTVGGGLTVSSGSVSLPDGSVALAELNPTGAANGQVIKRTAGVWTYGDDSTTTGSATGSNFLFTAQGMPTPNVGSIGTGGVHGVIEFSNSVAYVGGIRTAGRQISTNNRSISGQYSTNIWTLGGVPNISTNTLAANTIYRSDLRTRFMVWMLRVVVRGAADGAAYLYARVYGYVYLYGYVYGQGFVNYKAAWFNEGPNRAGWGRSNGITTTNDIMVSAVVPAQFNHWLTNRIGANGTGGSVTVLGTTSTSIP